MSYYDYRTSAGRARNGASFDAQRDDYEGYHSVNQLSDACAETTGVFAAAASRSAGAFGAALGGLIVLVFMLFWRLPLAGKVVFFSLLSFMAGSIYPMLSTYQSFVILRSCKRLRNGAFW